MFHFSFIDDKLMQVGDNRFSYRAYKTYERISYLHSSLSPCGAAGTRELFVIKGSAPKGYGYGTHRLIDPSETLAKISPHFSAMGLTRIADVTGLDSIGIPVCMAVRPNAKSLSVFQGKGLNLTLAKVSAAMEAIETYHAENDSLEVISASYQTLQKGADVIDPKRLNLHPQTIYHDQMTISWVEGYDLIQKKKTFVPYDLVHLKFLKGYTPMPIFTQGSNGLASGNHILEAISHAICEVIERDATALWELSRFEPQEDETIIDLDTIESPTCQKLIDMIHRAGLILYITNQTSNIGVPSFGCVITEGRPAGMKFRHGSSGGFGCHLSKEIALLRAVTEAAQSRLTHISGARDDMYRMVYLVQQQSASNFKHWKEVTENSQATLDFRTLPSLETNSLEDDVDVQLEMLKKVGLDQAVMVDLTDPKIGIPVVKMIIPGAEYRHTGFYKRFGKRAREQTLRAIIKKRFYSEFV